MLYPLNTFVPTTLHVISSIAPFGFFLSEREARDKETKANRETTFYFLIITKKYCRHCHHHHYFMYYTFESHFLHQLYLSLKCQHGKKPFIFKYCQVTFNFFLSLQQIQFIHTSFQVNYFFKMNHVLTFFSYLLFPKLKLKLKFYSFFFHLRIFTLPNFYGLTTVRPNNIKYPIYYLQYTCQFQLFYFSCFCLLFFGKFIFIIVCFTCTSVHHKWVFFPNTNNLTLHPFYFSILSILVT